MSTTTIPLDALGAAKDKARRDGYGRYLILPPGGAKPVGYSRVTTVAKALDDGGGLAPWKATMTVCGTIMRRGLRTQWEALMAEYGGDPWYSGTEGKAACKRLVEECSAAGGATDRRDTGTSLHTMTALADLGRPLTHLTEETEADLAAYRRTLDAEGITVYRDLIERTVVLDDFRVAGTFDRGVSVPGFTRPLIADLKCGADLSYSWQTIAVQLAAYSRGDALYEQGAAEDGSQDAREPMPEFDQENGLIIWLNAGTGDCELFLVDLTAGWEAFTHSVWARRWRNAHVAMPLDGGGWRARTDDLVPALEASLAATAPPAPAEQPDDVIDVDQPDYTTELRTWLQGRIDAIGQHPQAAADLARTWPGVPPLLSSADHSADDLAAIELCLNAVERQHKLLFPQPKPEPDDVGLVLQVFPNATIIDNTTEAPTS